MYQANLVAERLRQRHPDLQCEITVISTQGDRDKETPLSVIGGQGIFVKELEAAILSGEVDCAVHSLKDMPALLPNDLLLGAILERHDPRDVLISRHGGSIHDLPQGATVGTSSRRRVAQLLEIRPDVKPVELRGNIDTRIRKVLSGADGYDAGILAAAGLLRMEREGDVAEFLDISLFTPSPGQAALAVECREDDLATRALLAAIHDDSVASMVNVERAFLRGIGGGCRSPIGAYAEPVEDGIRLRGMLADEAMTTVRRVDEVLDPETAEEQAFEIATRVLASVAG